MTNKGTFALLDVILSQEPSEAPASIAAFLKATLRMSDFSKFFEGFVSKPRDHLIFNKIKREENIEHKSKVLAPGAE